MPTATDILNDPQKKPELPPINEAFLRYADVLNPVDFNEIKTQAKNALTGGPVDVGVMADIANRASALRSGERGAAIIAPGSNALTRAVAEKAYGDPLFHTEKGLDIFRASTPNPTDAKAGLAAALGLHGTAANTAASPYTGTAKMLAPLVGAIAGGVGDAGVLRGALRGTGVGAGAHVGGALGSVLADYLGNTKAVRGLSPNSQAAITLASLLGGNLLGGVVGYKATKALSKSDKEEKKEREEELREKYASIDRAYEALMNQQNK